MRSTNMAWLILAGACSTSPAPPETVEQGRFDRGGLGTGLLVHYAFDDAANPGGDTSGYHRDGTLVGNATLGAGRTGTGLQLDGNGSYLALPAGITDGLHAYTIAAWVDMAEARPWARLFDFGGDTGFTYLAADRGDGSLQLSIFDGAGNEGIVNGPAVTTGAWKHVAVTARGDDFRVYVDGVEAENQLTVPVAPGDIGSNDQGNWIGKSRFADPFLHGTVDDFRVYDRVLSPDEIRALAAPGTDYHDYRFDDCDAFDDRIVTDSSALGATGVAIHATAAHDGVYGGALALHGDGYVQLPGGIVSACDEVTVAAWVKLHANQPWNRVFDLGKSDRSAFLYLTTAGAGAAGQEIHAALVAPTGVVDLGFPFVVQLGEWNHVAVTLRDGRLSLYFNGREVAAQGGVTVKPSDMGVTDHDYLGKSQFADPGFDGELDDVRIACRGYAAGEIAQLAHLPLGDDPPMTLALSGDITNVHDPAIIAANGTYYVYSTAGGLQIRSSRDLVRWTFRGAVFQTVPAWVTAQLGITSLDQLWAPDVSYFGGKYHLYYSASTFGVNDSCIGHATTTDLATAWTDLGPVICTASGDDWNAIDPHVALDADGKPWLSAGSFWSGIHLFALTTDGVRADTNRYDLAETASTAIEASYIVYHAPYYYLFASYDACCRGAASTYHVRVGRATSITGPYFDQTGLDMRIGGGSPVVLGDSRFAGPGSNAILRIGNTWWNVYHAYDALAAGIPTLRIAQLQWREGWPVPEQP